MPDGSPLIALTLRYDRLDSFWFTLFHELAHVKKHLSENSTAYFDDMNNEMSKDIEKEADSYAKEMLIPAKIWETSGLNINSTVSETECGLRKNKQKIILKLLSRLFIMRKT